MILPMTNPEQHQAPKGFQISNIPLDILASALAASEIKPDAPAKQRFLDVAHGLLQAEHPDRNQTATAVTSFAEFAFESVRTPEHQLSLNNDGYLQETHHLITPKDPAESTKVALNNIGLNQEAIVTIDYKLDSQAKLAGDRSFFESSISVTLPVKDVFSMVRKWCITIKIHNGQAELFLDKAKVVKQGNELFEIPEEVTPDEFTMLAKYLQSEN